MIYERVRLILLKRSFTFFLRVTERRMRVLLYTRISYMYFSIYLNTLVTRLLVSIRTYIHYYIHYYNTN